jgi:hypothetical protein
MRSSSGGYQYSSPHTGRMMLGVRTAVLLARIHLTTVRWRFASEQYSRHILFAKYMPEALKRHLSSNQLPAICRHSLARESFSFLCSHLGYLIGSSGDATFTHVESSVPERGRRRSYVFHIQHVIYQNIWLPLLH